jgi:hypothetical protein
LALYNLKNGKTCSSYFGTIPSIGGGASQHCGSWNFTDVDQLKLFVNGTWYGDEYKSRVQVLMTVTDAQLQEFYNTSNANSFGSALAIIN